MKKASAILAGMASVLATQQSPAQTPGAINQVDSVQQRRAIEQAANAQNDGDTAPELFSGESSDVGPQSVLRIKEHRTHFEAQADVQYFYTDNMFLLEDDKQSSDVLVSTVQFALAPTAYKLWGGDFSPRLGYRHQWFNYGLGGCTIDNTSYKLSEFDFVAQTAFIGSQWRHGDWIIESGFDFTRLVDSSDYGEFYKEYVPRWGVQRLFPLCEASTLAVGYAGDYRFTEASDVPFYLPDDTMNRTDHALFAALTVKICEHAMVQPYYQFKYTRFVNADDRSDYLNSCGLAVYCFFTPNISMRAFVNYEMRDSTESTVPDYNRLDAGGGVNLTVRF